MARAAEDSYGLIPESVTEKLADMTCARQYVAIITRHVATCLQRMEQHQQKETLVEFPGCRATMTFSVEEGSIHFTRFTKTIEYNLWCRVSAEFMCLNGERWIMRVYDSGGQTTFTLFLRVSAPSAPA
jgi:hypothetical protein